MCVPLYFQIGPVRINKQKKSIKINISRDVIYGNQY